MRVGYLGDFRESWHTEVHMARDMRRLGHEVLDVNTLERDGTFDLWRVQRALQDPPDVLVYAPDRIGPEAIIGLFRWAEAKGTRTASHHLDLYVGLRRQRTIKPGSDPMWSAQFAFTPDGDPESAKFFAGKGINHHWLPAAIASTEAFPGRRRTALASDVAFVGGGAGYPHPEWPFRKALVQGLRRHYGGRYREYGHRSGMRGSKLADLYASVKVVVGDSVCLPGHRNYWSDRFYETVGRGGFLVGPNVPGIEQHFVGGQHLWLYEPGNLDHAISCVDFALRNDELRRDVATEGQEHVAAQHTYLDRARELLRVVSEA